ncbi:nonsense-mediated mRNA decay factor SMG7-like [Actinidia eriantha]|uniref:nonsense-mediated mRNA decay factor SMG7-like n=1 Tax=Actinidia eriantha TaxID=165200 RepID=UPI00258A72EF|nr:nonsense-mediated mRNA decay factor SMG7-like [Actinidia eriantha]XP_057483477.1 nonsense-mediated mRNA decay factor SMG7-like [Actinidia eriantha]
MMIVDMDKIAAPSSWELAQRLYDKNIELEKRRRRSAQARVPSDPNAWQQMRENYEAIILEDHAFSEQHNIEYALWQLHYRRIEEFRAHFSAALVSTSTSQGVKVPPRPDRINKIRLQFKTFLSEATGFYHDLILKIRAKYGLPLDYLSEDLENRIVMEKDGKRSVEMKKGLISCHRCLVYLGDLARYKGLYGEGDSKSRDYAAASSYYLQAVSIWPSSGNPHHQLAILATYSGDELVAVYRYFRSLAVDSPFSTARDNLIVAFEKNRQSYSLLHGDTKASAISESPSQVTAKGRGRGKAEVKLQAKDANVGARLVVEKTTGVHDTYKAFCICFVRLTGILFTHTSLETFAEVLSLVSSTFNELLSLGPEDELNFGTDAVENGLFIVRLISVILFTVHNVNKDGEGQTYADIVQHTVLLENALTSAFELVGHMVKRCVQLHDPCSSYLFPGILVFIEWLACSPDVAAGSGIDNKQATARSVFWNHCISFLNKLLSGSMVKDDEDKTCLFNTGRYEEGEAENRFALWEDFELRGFLPLQHVQTILDFSRKHSVRGDSKKEKIARVQRILAAGKALANVVKVDQRTITFDSKMKKFIVGVKPQISDDYTPAPALGSPKVDGMNQPLPTETMNNSNFEQPKAQLCVEGEEEDEVIVFKPTVMERQIDSSVSNWMPCEGLEPRKYAFAANSQFHGNSVSAHHSDVPQQTNFNTSAKPPVSIAQNFLQHLQPIQSHSSTWLDPQASLANGMEGLNILENGHASLSLPIQQSVNVNASGISYSQAKASEMVMQSKIDCVASSGVTSGTIAVNTSSAITASSRKSPVNRPVRHLGPPPGFTSVPPKLVNEPMQGSDLMADNLLTDDYRWLDGYKKSLPMQGSDLNQSINHPSQSSLHYVGNNNGSGGTNNFPFPGKQVPPKQFSMEKQNGWENNHALEHQNLSYEQLQPFIALSEQHQGKSMWGGPSRV